VRKPLIWCATLANSPNKELIPSSKKKYREVFCRDEGFDHVSRYVSGLVLCKNKTLQGIYAQQVWPEGEEVTRRAMHAGVFEAGWWSAKLMRMRRAVTISSSCSLRGGRINISRPGPGEE